MATTVKELIGHLEKGDRSSEMAEKRSVPTFQSFLDPSALAALARLPGGLGQAAGQQMGQWAGLQQQQIYTAGNTFGRSW